MQFLPANIYSIASVREIDRRAIEENDLSGYTLMQRAAAAAVQVARQQYPDAKRWQIICGPGNNGGDGYVVARLAAHDGIVASVVTLVDPDSLSGDAATAYQDFAAEGGIVMPWAGELDAEADLLVDALLGSGLQRDVSGDYAVAVRAINEHPGVVQALDIATGINGDTGAVMGSASRRPLLDSRPGCFLVKGRISAARYPLLTLIFLMLAMRVWQLCLRESMSVCFVHCCRHGRVLRTKVILGMF
jgi:NAD(P)H-hydrate epimerase